MAPRPNTFTKAEQVIERLAEMLITDGRPYKKIAADMGVSVSTIGNLARRETRWPRPNTFFSIINHYEVDFSLYDKGGRRKRG